jgi:transcriptional regulator with XRE-family HTH domain
MPVQRMAKEKPAPPSASAPRATGDKSSPSTAQAQPPNFAQVIRTRRIELRLTLKEVASRIGTSKPYIAHLESGSRHPSDKVVAKLADALALDNRELFLLANPHARALVSAGLRGAEGSVWEDFQKNAALQRLYNITNEEMEVLSGVALLGEVRSSRDLLYVLNAIRNAVGK